MATNSDINSSKTVLNLKDRYESLTKPKPPTKRFRYINGRVTFASLDETPVNHLDEQVNQCEMTNDLISENSDVDILDSKLSESESNSELEVLSKPECISRECLAYLEQVHRCLKYLEYFKEELDKEFANDTEVMKPLSNVFRDVSTLLSTYVIILETIERFKSNESGIFYLYDIFLDSVVSSFLKMYKPFLSQYAINAKWMGEFAREQQRCIDAIDRARKQHDIVINMNMDNCLYTVFNSLFSLELMLDRYKKCFEEASEQHGKAEEAKNLISNLLSVINTNQDQDNFLETQKQLNLLTGRSKESKINTRFIYKGTVTKYARRDDKPLTRQLVLFSDCLFVTMVPGNIVGNSSVRQELSIESMKVTEIQDEDIPDVSNFKYGLSINAKEAVQDFYFESESAMRTWKDKILYAIKEEIGGHKGEYIDKVPTENHTINNCMVSLGSKAPRWQKDRATGYCNGHRCSQKFSTAIRRHHCRADGLLYCDSCCNYKIKLEFDRSEESRVCELCYQILSPCPSNLKQVDEAKQLLDTVMRKKTRTGKITGWLLMKKYNKDRNVFMSEVNYYCNLHSVDPILQIYERHEDKCHKELIILFGMEIKTSGDVSQYYKTLSSKQFIIEHKDKIEVYLMKAPNQEECQKWVQCLKDRISTSLND